MNARAAGESQAVLGHPDGLWSSKIALLRTQAGVPVLVLAEHPARDGED